MRHHGGPLGRCGGGDLGAARISLEPGVAGQPADVQDQPYETPPRTLTLYPDVKYDGPMNPESKKLVTNV